MRLGVNIDHIATVRQARRGAWPDPVEAALICQRAGATSVVCHLREDRRHIRDEDVRRLKRALSIPLNLEISIAPSVIKTALAIRPDQITLVPERRQELTTEGGLDALTLRRRLQPIVRRFQQRRIAVSLFVEPAISQLDAARALGVESIELHTGRYANAAAAAAAGRRASVQALQRAAAYARGTGLAVAAGHGIGYDNVQPIARLRDIEELNIGFSIISRALWVGLDRAVREMRRLLQ